MNEKQKSGKLQIKPTHKEFYYRDAKMALNIFNMNGFILYFVVSVVRSAAPFFFLELFTYTRHWCVWGAFHIYRTFSKIISDSLIN